MPKVKLANVELSQQDASFIYDREMAVYGSAIIREGDLAGLQIREIEPLAQFLKDYRNVPAISSLILRLTREKHHAWNDIRRRINGGCTRFPETESPDFVGLLTVSRNRVQRICNLSIPQRMVILAYLHARHQEASDPQAGTFGGHFQARMREFLSAQNPPEDRAITEKLTTAIPAEVNLCAFDYTDMRDFFLNNQVIATGRELERLDVAGTRLDVAGAEREDPAKQAGADSTSTSMSFTEMGLRLGQLLRLVGTGLGTPFLLVEARVASGFSMSFSRGGKRYTPERMTALALQKLGVTLSEGDRWTDYWLVNGEVLTARCARIKRDRAMLANARDTVIRKAKQLSQRCQDYLNQAPVKSPNQPGPSQTEDVPPPPPSLPLGIVRGRRLSRNYLSLSNLSLAPGDQIELMFDSKITAVVRDDAHLEYQGQLYTLAALTNFLSREASLQGRKVSYRTHSATFFWYFRGRKLQTLENWARQYNYGDQRFVELAGLDGPRSRYYVRFSDIGIPVGATLQHRLNPEAVAQVLDDGKVMYNGTPMKLSDISGLLAGKYADHRDSDAVYADWTYEGVPLATRALKFKENVLLSGAEFVRRRAAIDGKPALPPFERLGVSHFTGGSNTPFPFAGAPSSPTPPPSSPSPPPPNEDALEYYPNTPAFPAYDEVEFSPVVTPPPAAQHWSGPVPQDLAFEGTELTMAVLGSGDYDSDFELDAIDPPALLPPPSVPPIAPSFALAMFPELLNAAGQVDVDEVTEG